MAPQLCYGGTNLKCYLSPWCFLFSCPYRDFRDHSAFLASTHSSLTFFWLCFSACGILIHHCYSVAKLCLCLCSPMDCSMPGFSVLNYLLEFAKTHVHWVDEVIQPSHPLFLPSHLTFNLSQHQGLFLKSQLFTSGGQNIGASASAPVLPMNIHDWFPLGLTGLIPLLSKGFSRVFSSPTVPKHQFFGTQPSLGSNSHICTWLLEKTDMDIRRQSDASAF